MSESQTVRGYRVLGDPPKPDKQLSYENLRLKPEAAHALKHLRDAVTREEGKRIRGEGPGVPCVRNPEFFSGKTLPTDAEAQLACAPCPAKTECGIYLLIAHPAHGVYDGVVRGRELDRLIEEGENDEDSA